MAFATLSPINHGLGAVTIGGAFKLQSGKIILFIADDTEVYEMADVDTAAVSIFTASFALKAGSAGTEFIGGGDRVVITGFEKFVYIEYPGPTVVEDDLPLSFVGVDSVITTFGGDGNYFYVLGRLYPDIFAAHIQPLDPTGYTMTEWTALVSAYDQLWEYPGQPVFVNAWPLAAAIDDYDASNYATWRAGGPFQELDKTFIVTQNRPVACYHRGNTASKKIVGSTGGWIFTDLGGEFQMPEDVLCVFWSIINSQYVLLEFLAGGETIKYSTDGTTWNSATAADLPEDLTEKDRGYFASLETYDVLAFRMNAITSSPNTRWWRSTDDTSWTSMGLENDTVIGFYSNSVAGPSEVVKISTINGDILWSANEGTSFTGPVSGLITAADAARLRWVQETPTGLIAWGPEGPILTQVAADLHTVNWIDEGWPGGRIGPGLRVLDDGEIRVHRNFVGTETNLHYELWSKPFGGAWERLVNPKYDGCLGLAPSWLGLTAGSNTGYVMAAIGFNPNEQILVEKFSSVVSLDNPSWINDIDPDAFVLSTGPRQLLVLGEASRFKYVSVFNLDFFGDRHVGWNDAVDQFRDNDGGQVLVTGMFADGDVLCAVGIFAGWLATSDNGSEWLPVLFNTDLRDGHRVIEAP